MKYRYMLLLMLTASFVLVTMCANAAVVTVTPESMQGWSIEDFWEGKGDICTYGPASYENKIAFQTDDGSMNFGRGAFYASTGYGMFDVNDKTPSTVWLGLDTHNGQSLAGITLNSITKMDYWSFVTKNPSDTVTYDANWESWKENWWNPFQPIQLQLTAENATGTERRTFAHRPWGNNNIRGDQDNELARGVWQHINPFASGRWVMHPAYAGNPEVIFQNWSALSASEYGSWKLVATVPDGSPWKSPGWKGNNEPGGNPPCTATGKCLNFEVGARHLGGPAAPIFPSTTTTGESVDGAGAWSNWGAEGVGFRGHVDYFTLGVNNVDVTYNFEPSASASAPQIVQATNKAVHSILAQQTPAVKNNFMFKVAGKVVATGNLSENPWAEIDDGSGAIIRVYNVPAITHVGDYYSSWGLAEWPRFTRDPLMKICVWAHKNHSELLHEGGDIW